MSRGRTSVVFLGFAAIATVACPLAAGCMVEEGMVTEDESEVGVSALALTGDPEDPPQSSNPFRPACFWNAGVQQTYRELATGPLVVNTLGHLPNMPNMPAQPAGWAGVGSCRPPALKYLIRCALPQNTSVTDPTTGFVYHGHLGIAPGWRTGALSNAAKPWITSCLLQHLNGYGTSVPLLLEGYLSGFYMNPTLQSQYPKRDSIAWGNLFTTVSGPPFVAHVCYFNETYYSCNDVVDATTQRICDEEPGCNLEIEGNCTQECTWDASGYWSCDGVNSFRSRLKDLDMYGLDCSPPG
jgi:hypothetical protein